MIVSVREDCCHFPVGILGHVWCLVVLIPDLCPLSYFIYINQGVARCIRDFDGGRQPCAVSSILTDRAVSLTHELRHIQNHDNHGVKQHQLQPTGELKYILLGKSCTRLCCSQNTQTCFFKAFQCSVRLTLCFVILTRLRFCCCCCCCFFVFFVFFVFCSLVCW